MRIIDDWADHTVERDYARQARDRISVGVVARIASDSAPGTYYDITIDDAGHLECPCKGFAYRAHCRHVAEAAKGWLSTLESLRVAARRMRQQAERVMQDIDATTIDREKLDELWLRVSAMEETINAMCMCARKATKRVDEIS